MNRHKPRLNTGLLAQGTSGGGMCCRLGFLLTMKHKLLPHKIIAAYAQFPLLMPQDKKYKGKVDARNQLESYCYNMKQTVEEKMKDKIEEDDKDKIKSAVEEALEWLSDNQDAEAEDYEERLKDLQDVCSPIISAAYSAAGEGGEASNEDLGDHDEL